MKIIIIDRIILKLIESAVMDIFRNFRRFFQNGDKILDATCAVCTHYLLLILYLYVLNLTFYETNYVEIVDTLETKSLLQGISKSLQRLLR